MRCGIDIIEISRIEDAIKKNDGFLKRVFSDAEIEYYNKKSNGFESLAGFFAAKEAYAKFLGTGIRGFNLSDVSVSHDESGNPSIFFKGERQPVSLSISHNTTTAVAVVTGEEKKTPVLLKDEMSELIPKRPRDSHKGDFGRVLVVAGSKGMIGAAALSAYAALRTGAGLVTLAVPESERLTASGFYPEIMTEGLIDEDGMITTDAMKKLLKLSAGKDTIVFGPGLGKSQSIHLILTELLRSFNKTLIIDADGLNALSKNPDILNERTCKVILTPHPGEMSRLLGSNVQEVQKNRLETANAFAKKYGVLVTLKGYETVVADSEKDCFINPTGNSGMAKAGSGDVLSGVIGAFLAQGMDAFESAKLGVYIHGLAGDIAREERGVHGILASDIADKVPEAILRVLE